MKKIDIHTHILPGVDDGAKDWETCLSMLVQSARHGVDAIIATPHYLPWKQKASAKEVETLCVEAKKKLFEKHGITMDIYPGNEIYYNVDAIHDLKAGKSLSLAGSRYVLVEFQQGSPYQSFCRAVKEFRDGGYIPILAHIERCNCLRNMEKMQELREMGALFQMNVEAFQGGIFDKDSRWAKKCLKERKVDFLASDMHGTNHRPPMMGEELRWIQKNLEPEYQKELLYGNAQKIMGRIRV